MKVAFITAVWKRPEVFKLFDKGIKELIKKFPNVELEVYIAGSEKGKSKRMVTKAGYNYIEVANNPLGNKMNAACYSAKKSKADYYILLGSDDIIHPTLFRRYLKEMRKGYDYIYLTDCYFYDLDNDKSAYWGGYNKKENKGHALGAGKVLSKSVMDLIDYICWDKNRKRALDTSFNQIVMPYITTKKELNCKRDNVMILDIKNKVNMTPFRLWDNTKFINKGIIKTKFRYLWK